ncbi:hypothetical protein PoB_003860900 [Plakobranchus ocellatus]|uniref:Uncharacterized protein n=1 Tax=Plakobranchus ocellatus TaxID=259542 RepID=A0AAV4B162_9GAST|nr:hypothetical protein PoB_003860900 [Plakobranchus ocellatus]
MGKTVDMVTLSKQNLDIPCERTSSIRGVSGIVDIESALRSAKTLLSRIRALPPVPWPDGGPESLRSPCCELAIFKIPSHRLFKNVWWHNGQ